MTSLNISYDGKPYSVYYHEDLIRRIAAQNNTFFEDWLLTELKNRVESFDFTIDIGANVGNHAVFFKKVCEAKRLVAFEPISENYKLLELNCLECELYNLALSNHNGTAFMSMRDSLTNNSGTPSMSNSGIEVTVKTLDDYAFSNVTFIKIDVEGHELSVIDGAINTINQSKPDLLVEIHTGVSEIDVLNRLPEGYTFEKITHESHYLYKFSK